jgi:hypothetical protein
MLIGFRCFVGKICWWRPGRRWDAAVPPQTFSPRSFPSRLRSMARSRLGRDLLLATRDRLRGHVVARDGLFELHRHPDPQRGHPTKEGQGRPRSIQSRAGSGVVDRTRSRRCRGPVNRSGPADGRQRRPQALGATGRRRKPRPRVEELIRHRPDAVPQRCPR